MTAREAETDINSQKQTDNKATCTNSLQLSVSLLKFARRLTCPRFKRP